MGELYRSLRLVARHVIVARSHLPEQSLLHDTHVLSISGVVPIVDQASPDSASFPPEIRLSEYARRLPWVCTVVVVEYVFGHDARGILDGGCSGISKVRCSRLRSVSNQD